jgi:hypothetical protein
VFMFTSCATLHVHVSCFIPEVAVHLNRMLSYSFWIYVFHVQRQGKVVSLDLLLQWKMIALIKERL